MQELRKTGVLIREAPVIANGQEVEVLSLVEIRGGMHPGRRNDGFVLMACSTRKEHTDGKSTGVAADAQTD